MKTPIAVALATTFIAAGITAGYAQPAPTRHCHSKPIIFCTGIYGQPCKPPCPHTK